MQREYQCTQENQDISFSYGEPLRNTQKIQTRQSHRHRRPHLPADLLSEKDPQHRHDHDIKGGNKSCFPRRRILNSDLLKAAGAEQHHAAGNSPGHQILPA